MKLNKISSGINKSKKTNNNIMIFGTALTAMLTLTAYAAENEPKTNTDDIEVIQVTGMLGSMKASALLKRTDNRIVDAIVAEDIGKLPDNNIAEALQRITGVSVNTDFGVGESVTIRGISQNRVELNGRSTSGAGRGGISLDDFPSSFLKTVEVIKSPTPEMIEGALGGTINMTTVRPLELDEPLIALSLDGEFADKTETWGPKFNISAGTNWDFGDSGTFGASFVFAYQDRELRRDEFLNLVTPTALDLDGDGNIDQSNNAGGTFLVRSQNTLEQKTEQRERTAYGLSLQWAPKDSDGFLYLDINGTKLDGYQAAYSILNDSKDYGDLVLDNAYGDAQGTLHNFGSGSVYVQPKTRADFTAVDSQSNAIGGEFYLTDQLFISGELSYSKSEGDRFLNDFTQRPISRDQFEADGTIDEHVFTITLSEDGEQVPNLAFSDANALTTLDNMAIRQFGHQKYYEDNEETAVRLDLEYTEPFSGLDFITSVKAGVRATDREYTLDRYQLRVNGSELKDLQKKVTYDGVFTPNFVGDFQSAYGGFITIDHSNTLDQTGISGSNDLAKYYVYDGELLAKDIHGAFDSVKQMLEGSSHEITGSLEDNMVRQTGTYANIEETTQAIYTQFALDFDNLTAIIGGRYVTTDLTSNTFDESGKNNYSDFLPSINATYTLNDDTLLRFAAAKVMRRAEFGELSPATDLESSLVTGTQGSFELEPYRVTQYDLSVEHYFGEGGLVSAAIFYKDVQSFTESATTCVADSETAGGQNVTEYVNVCLLDSVGVSQDKVNYASGANNNLAYVEGQRDAGLTGIVIAKDVNGGSGKVAGLELAFQQQLTFLPGAWSGLGISTNYTYADSEQPDGNPLQNISNHTFNGQVYWEYESIQLRLAYNWRDKYLVTQNEKRVRPVGALATGVYNLTDPDAPNYDPTLGNNYRDARGQFDLSASYDINENISVVASAVNFTGEPIRQLTELDSIWKYTEADRRFTVGVRAKF